MKKLLPLLFVSVIGSSTAQNYKLFNASSRYYFTNSTSLYTQLFGFACDSVKQVGADSVYYPFRVLGYNPSLGNCNVIPDFDNWTGKTIVTTPAGDHELVTYSSGSFFIKPTTAYLDTFTALTFGNGNTLRAIYTDRNMQTFAGISDSVRTYTLQMFDVSGSVLNDDWNGKTIRISKNNGVVEIPNIRDFPNDTSMMVRTTGKRLTWGDVYTWQTGDIIHENRYSNGLTPPWYLSNHTLYNIEVLSRNQINADSVVFTLKRKMNFVQNYPPVNTITYDTIQKSVGKLTQFIFDEMPEQTIDSIRSYSLYRNAQHCGGLRIEYHALNSIFNMGGGCLHYETFEPYIRDSVYIENIGGHFYTEWPHFFNSDSYNGLNPVYINSASLTCGTPQFIGLEETEVVHDKVQCNPNPASDYFVVSGLTTGKNPALRLFDMAGKLVLSAQIKENEKTDISFLQNGCYAVHIETNNTLYCCKLVISHR